MSDDINYKNNPLHGVGLKEVLTQLVGHYGFEILFAYLNINCFKTNPSIESSVKFLKKTDWAREKVEIFYLYEYKNLPRASSTQFALPPRDRIIPADQSPGEPKELSLEDAERLREKRAKKAAEHGQNKNRGSNRRSHSKPGHNNDSSTSRADRSQADASESTKVDPWAKWRDK